MYEYNPDVVHNENSNSWEKIPDRRVEYVSEKYPWLVAAYRYHNKVNMHFEVCNATCDVISKTRKRMAERERENKKEGTRKENKEDEGGGGGGMRSKVVRQ